MEKLGKSRQEILSEAAFFADTIHNPVNLDYVSDLIGSLLHYLENLPSDGEILGMVLQFAIEKHAGIGDGYFIIPHQNINLLVKAISARINQDNNTSLRGEGV